MGKLLTIRHLPWEAIIWICGLIYLAAGAPGGNWSICPLDILGLDFCPGCGLGKSVSLIFKGEWEQAWAAHPLGFAALPILSIRSLSLLHKTITNNNNSHHGTSTRSLT